MSPMAGQTVRRPGADGALRRICDVAPYRSGTPLYLQIARELQARIDSGEFEVGGRLPSEQALCVEFGVNRLTIRQAVAELERAAALEIRRGVGTFVRPPAVRISISVDPRRQQLDPDNIHITHPPASRDHTTERVLAVHAADTSFWSREAAHHLGRPAEALTRMDTLIPMGTEDFTLNSYWIPSELLTADLAEPGDNDNLMVRFCRATGIRIEYDWRAFSAVAADLADAELLGVPVGTPLLVREGVSCRPDGEPLVYVRRRLKGDTARYILRYRERDTDRPE
jgi:GntR family transcriptional regulator